MHTLLEVLRVRAVDRVLVYTIGELHGTEPQK